MRKVIILLCSIWTAIAVMAMLIYYLPFRKASDGMTVNQDYASFDAATYISDNLYGRGVITKFDSAGKKKELFYAKNNQILKDYQVEAICANQTVYGVFSDTVQTDDGAISIYRIASFDDSLHLLSLTDELYFGDQLYITDLTTNATSLYVTALNHDCTESYVYDISISTLKPDTKLPNRAITEISSFVGGASKDSEEEKDNSEEDTEEGTEVYRSCTPFFTEYAPENRVFAQCGYLSGEFYSRLDNEVPGEYFVIPESVRNTYDNYDFSLTDLYKIRGVYFTHIILAWGIGICLLIILTIVLYGRSRVFYSGVVLELVLLIIIIFGTAGVIRSYTDVREADYTDFCEDIFRNTFRDLDLAKAAEDMGSNGDVTAISESFFTSESYQRMYEDLQSAVFSKKAGHGFSDLMVVNQKTGDVVLSGSGLNLDKLANTYGDTVHAYMTKANGDIRIKDIKNVSGQAVITKTLDSKGLKGYVLVGIFDYKQQPKEMLKDNHRTIIRGLLFLLIATILVIVILVLESRELHEVAVSLKNLAEGRGEVKSMRVHGKDLTSMKNSVFEIEKNIASVNRAKYKIFEAYYRFAPKYIERMLGKESITEVEIGDHTIIRGTMAILSMKDRKKINADILDRMNHIFETVEKQREAYGGVYVTNNETLSKTRLIFPDNKKETVNFGTEVLNSLLLNEKRKRDYSNVTILLHYTNYFYGVCGTENQSMTFLVSQETEKLADMVDWLRSLRLSLVVTGQVLAREEGYGETRYIGYVLCDGQQRIDLYEVLGAQSNRVSKAKLATKAAFEAAIQLYYDQDFFLARNAFTEILREFPEDELVKWYLFECENHLNGTFEGNFNGALHS